MESSGIVISKYNAVAKAWPCPMCDARETLLMASDEVAASVFCLRAHTQLTAGHRDVNWQQNKRQRRQFIAVPTATAHRALFVDFRFSCSREVDRIYFKVQRKKFQTVLKC